MSSAKQTTTVKTTAIKQAQLLELLATSGLSVASSTVLAIILAYVLHDLIASHIIIAWLLVFISLNIARFIVMLKNKRNPAVTQTETDKQLIQFRIGLIASGVLWAFATTFMYPANAPTHQMFIIFMLAGLTAGAAVSYSVDFISAVTFVLLLLTPVLARLFLGQDELALAMTISLLLYIGFMMSNIHHVNRKLLNSISARFDADQREIETKQLAFYDSLTSLPNRRLMIDRINHALALSKRTSRGGALFFLDLDNFKLLNDSLGHDMGDLQLKQVADRLVSCVRASDTVARWGGDEFTIMLEDLSQDATEAAEQVKQIASQIMTSLNLPYQLNSHQYHSTASIGVAMFADVESSHEELLKNADIAMYEAKRAGRNVVRCFDTEMQSTIQSVANRGVEG